MDKDFSELVEYLDEKFQKTAAKEDLKDFAKKEDLEKFATKEDLKALAEKFVSLEEFDQFRTEVRGEFKELRLSIQNLTNAVDSLVKAVSDLRTEYVAICHQLTRHEKWIQQIAEKSGVKLEY